MSGTDGVLTEILRNWWQRPRSRATVAIALAAIALAMAGWLLLSDLDWKRKHDSAMERARWAVNAGNIESARDWLRYALEFNPYSADAHFRLADILNKYFADNELALRHYLEGLKYGPNHHAVTEATKAVAALDMIMTGIIEDPMDAARDMALAARDGAYSTFAMRLGPTPALHVRAYWDGWRKRGLGKPIHRRLQKNDQFDFDAVLGFAFDDGSSMSMHFFCRAGEPWRLVTGFP